MSLKETLLAVKRRRSREDLVILIRATEDAFEPGAMPATIGSALRLAKRRRSDEDFKLLIGAIEQYFLAVEGTIPLTNTEKSDRGFSPLERHLLAEIEAAHELGFSSHARPLAA